METSISVLIFFDKIEVHQPSHMRSTRTLKVLDAKNTSFSFSKVLVSAVVWNAANINHSNAFFNIVDKKNLHRMFGFIIPWLSGRRVGRRKFVITVKPRGRFTADELLTRC